jgi:hypothetical protein
MRVLADAEASGVDLAGPSESASSLRDLRALTSEKLLEAARRQHGMAWPIVDGWVIPDDQYRLYEAGRFNDTPILLGYNSDDGLSFSPDRTPEDYIAGVKKGYGPFADRLLEAYPTASDFVPKTARDLARDSALAGKRGCGRASSPNTASGKLAITTSISTRNTRPALPRQDAGPTASMFRMCSSNWTSFTGL